MLHIVVRTLFNSEFYVNKKLSIKGNLQITLIVNIPYMMDKYQAINYKIMNTMIIIVLVISFAFSIELNNVEEDDE